ncbi:hypothetical protein YSY43_02250 [Paenibacillus sp. YSY-4.3]
MVPVRLVLAARDEQYIEPFLHYIRHSEFDRSFFVTAFSREDAFVRHMESSRLYADVVLAEKPFLEAWLGGGETPPVPYIYLEEDGNAKGYGKSISKYQPLPLLLTAVLECARGGTAAREPAEGKALVVGVYSAVGGCGKTTVAAHLVKQLAGEGRKVFYLNLETIGSGFLSENPSLREGQNRAPGFARLLYDLKAAGERGEPMNQPVSAYAYRHPVLESDTFGPVDNLNEMLEMESGDTARLIDFIADSGLYDTIIADVDSYPNTRTEAVLERSDKLVWLLADEWNVMRKSGLWISHMERSNPERFRRIMGKALFAVNRCMGEAVQSLPRPGLTAEIVFPYIPSWNQGASQGALLHSPAFQKAVLKLCRSLYSGRHSLGIGGTLG